MKKVFTTEEFGSIRVIIWKNRSFFNFSDLMQGLTLIDEQDTLNRLGQVEFRNFIAGRGKTERYLA